MDVHFNVKKDRISEENVERAKIREMLQASNISGRDDIQNPFKETMAEFMENGLAAELEAELGYNKYDYLLLWMSLKTHGKRSILRSHWFGGRKTG